jgi:chromosome segregation ATPase
VFKPLIQKLHEQIQQRPPSFAPVYAPGEALPAIEDQQSEQAAPEAGEHPYDAFRRLLHLRCESPHEQEKKKQLIASVTALIQEVEAFEQRILERRRGEISEQWEKVRTECRAQLQAVEKARAKVINAEAKVESAIAEREHTMTALQAANSARLPAYPTKSEIAKREAAINEARAVAQAAERTLSYAIGDRYQAQQELKQAEEKMAELGTEERRLRHELDGKEYFDAEYGLKV